VAKKKPEPFIYNATCLRVVDGDTLDALVDLGFNVHIKQRIRLYGVDTWESRTRDKAEKVKGLAAKARVKELLDDQRFLLKSHGVGKFGRCLGEVFYGDKKLCLATLLLKEGHAYTYFGGNKQAARKK